MLSIATVIPSICGYLQNACRKTHGRAHRSMTSVVVYDESYTIFNLNAIASLQAVALIMTGET